MKGTALKYDEQFDVVIVGSGFAGLAAAIEAAEAGASVLVLEKMKGVGGNSIISDGVIAAAGTKYQAASGIEDSPELMARDMLTAGLGLNQPRLVNLVAGRSNEALEWTIDYVGVKYLDQVDQFGGHSVPRCLTASNMSGSGIVMPLAAKAREAGAEIRTAALVEEFLRDDAGRVCGLRIRLDYKYPHAESGRVVVLGARRGVVLASGGFANDLAFRTAQDPRLDEKVDSTNRVCTTAEALKQALRLGAAPVHLSWIQLGPWTSPDEKMFGAGPAFASYVALPYGLLINPDTCRRFVNELGDRRQRADALLAQGKPSVVLADQSGVSRSGRSLDKALAKKVVVGFPNLDDLAGYFGLDPEPLKETVDRFNRFVENGRDDDFNKPILSAARPLVHPPFYAMRLWPKVHHTMGGVRIDEAARVLDLDGRPIPGFYAAGEVAGGIHGASRLGSCAIPDCLVFGRIAGQSAAAEV